MIRLLRGVWRFRGFIAASVRREFAARYQGTQLGMLWPVLHPLALVAIYTVIFSEVMRPRLPGDDSRFAYSIYLTAGFVAWTLFGDLLARSVGIFVQNAGLLRKVNVHKLAFPAIASISAAIQAGILFACFLAFLAVTGNLPGAEILAVVPLLALTALLAMGLGLFLSIINVFYRDVEQSTGLLLQFWFWLTPIVYPIASLPQPVQNVLAWNPMWPLVRGMQDVFSRGRWPEWDTLAYPLAVAIGFALLARLAFGRLGGELVDEL